MEGACTLTALINALLSPPLCHFLKLDVKPARESLSWPRRSPCVATEVQKRIVPLWREVHSVGPPAHQQHCLVQPSQRRQHRSVGLERSRGHTFFSFCPEPSRKSLVLCEARVLTCCFAHLWNVIALAWMSQLLTLIQCCEHPRSQLVFVWVQCGFAFWTCCVLFS